MDGFLKGLLETKVLGHACEMETSMVMAADPGRVHLDRLDGRVYACQPPPDVAPAFTTVEWVSRWPEMAVGDPSRASRAKGVRILEEWAQQVAKAVRKIKRDRVTPRVMKVFRSERVAGGTLKRYGRSVVKMKRRQG